MFAFAAATVAGFALLIWGADRFVIGAAGTARHMGVPTLLIGLTIVALATSAPEILVSISAATHGNPELAVGNAIGSNIANIALVLGLTAAIRPMEVRSTILRREMPALLAVTLLSMVVGVVGAFGSPTMRGVLTFHMVSQVGYILVGIVLAGAIGMAAVVFYLVHHTVVKTSLFLSVGAIEVRRGTGEIDKLVAMGFVPEDQAMGARMMMGMFAQPGDGDDVAATASYAQARAPIYRSSIGRHRHYADQLALLARRLGVRPDEA